MNFVEAVREADNGKKVRHHNWDEGIYIKKFGYILVINGEMRNKYCPTILSILDDNWEVLE